MKLHVLSDVHLEFQKCRNQSGLGNIDCDVHVLAGDIGVGLAGIEWALHNFSKPVIYVFGNHEFYGQRPMSELWEKARKKVEGTHVHLLENDVVILPDRFGENVRFIGATLWTDFCILGQGQQQHAMMEKAKYRMNDYMQIFVTRRGSRDIYAGIYESGTSQPQRSGDRLTPKKTLSIHHDSRDFIEQALRDPSNNKWDKTVVVTHHAPSAKSLHGDGAYTSSDAGYASDLEYLVQKVDLWIHGHVHEAKEINLPGGGRVLTNCRGYSDKGPRAVERFDWKKLVEV